MNINCINNKSALLIFAKSPEPGKVKTRLIPDIGVDAATNLYMELLKRTLSTSDSAIFSEKQLWLSGDKEHVFFNNVNSFKFMYQVGDDLGERMFNAFEYALTEHDYAILIGCDCPGLTNQDLRLARDMLEADKDIVLGPAEDGGYYLIGLKHNNINLFSNIEWGSDKVFSKTLSIAKRLSLNIGLLTKRNDIDRFSDLESFEKIKKQECLA